MPKHTKKARSMQLFLVLKPYKHMLASVYKQGWCQKKNIRRFMAFIHWRLGFCVVLSHLSIFVMVADARYSLVWWFQFHTSTGDIAARTLFGKEWVARQYNEPK